METGASNFHFKELAQASVGVGKLKSVGQTGRMENQS